MTSLCEINKDRSLAGRLGRAIRRPLQKIQLWAGLLRRLGPSLAWQAARSSKSQLGQDLFALSELGPAPGFFVEFGATNGIERSNTWVLEKLLGWEGLLAEPARCWHEALATNRGCQLERRCVWKSTGERLSFDEVTDPELSTLGAFSASDFHQAARQSKATYEVETVSLEDLLASPGIPSTIDFLSIDTEGSEYEILSTYDFKAHPIKVIVCEHNYSPIRERIHALLSAHGYVRKYPDLSRFDDWYVLAP